MLHSILIYFMLIMQGQTVASQPTESIRMTREQILHYAIIDNVISDPKRYDAVVSLGPEVAHQIEQYLSYSDRGVRRRALQVLAKIPGTGEEVMIRALASRDEILRSIALRSAGPALKNPAVRDAWISCFTGPLRGTDARYHACQMFWTLPPQVREQVAQELLPRIIERLETFDVNEIYTVLLLLGQIAQPGDKTVLDAINRIRDEADALYVQPEEERRRKAIAEMYARGESDVEKKAASLYPLVNIDMRRRERDCALEAVLFAQANLGDAKAFASFFEGVISGEKELRLSRLKLLPSFHSNAEIIQLTVRLLDDKTELELYGPFGIPQRNYRRTCDFAVDAIGKWFPEMADLVKPPRIYRDADIAKARQCLQTAIQHGVEETNNQPRETTDQDPETKAKSPTTAQVQQNVSILMLPTTRSATTAPATTK